jgi:hypothetical protein
MSSISLNQGNIFKQKQERVTSKKIQKSKYKNPDLSHNKEGLTTMNGVSLEGSNEAQISSKTLSKTEVNSQMLTELEKLNAQYKTAIQATQDAQNKYNAGITDYISRTNPLINKNSNKNVKLSDGTIGYMTNRGVFEQYDDINKTAGINGCPRASDITDLGFGLADIIKHPDMIAFGPNKPVGTACGNEGTNIYVNSVLTEADVKYLGCYTNSPGAMTAIDADNYDDCKLYAMNNGYKYFGLVNANPSTQQVTCVVGNDKAKITSKELGYVFNEKVLFSISSGGSISALLTNEGQIVLLSAFSGTGTVYTRVPASPAPNCQQGGTIRIDNATYGSNCNAYTNTTTNQECLARFFGYCFYWKNVSSQSPRFPFVAGNNVQGMLKYNLEFPQNNSQNSPVTTIINDMVDTGLSLFTTGVNTNIFGDPAPGCNKNFIGNYYCGATSRQLSANDNGSITMDCTDVIATCQFYLILQDDGNMCIYRGTGPNDNKGLIWQSQTNGQQFTRGNPKSLATLGKYGRNYMRVGEYLNPNEWIGSTNGSLKLMMNPDGSLVLYTTEAYDSWITLNNGKIASVSDDFTAVYELSNVGIPGNLGKMGYIDDNGALSEYPSNMIGPGTGYNAFKNINSPYNDLKNMPIINSSPESCASACDSNVGCFGYVYDKSTRNCWLKNKNVLQNNTNNNPATDFYLRNTKVIGSEPSCDTPVINVDSTRWSQYKTSGNAMTDKTPCNKFANMEEMPVLAYKQDFENKKKVSDDLAAKISAMNRTLQNRRDMQHAQTTQNTKTDVQNNSVYNITTDTKIPKAIEVSVNKESFTNYDDMNSPSQRAKSVQFKNIDAIVEDSDLVAVQENYNYILWSILALMTTIIVVKSLRSQ